MTLVIDMQSLLLAFVVGVLFSAGTFLILRRGQVKLVLGLGLLSHGVNLLLFGTGILTIGSPPIIEDRQNYLAGIERMADPLPQALILTAIVISFGMTAFIVVLMSRRDALTGSDIAPGELAYYLNTIDPFASRPQVLALLEAQADEDYDLLHAELDEVYDLPSASAPYHEE